MLNIICVSYDGTWMKRGFTSQYGVGVAIDTLTGLVIDYEVMSLYCHWCVDNKTWTGVAIDILTGLVIDYEVMSLYCHGCVDNKTWTGVAIDTLTGLVIDYEVMSLYCHGCIDNKTWTSVAICVSYDGTWMKRGFTSQYGVGVAIDILTGLVIDYEVMSLYCHGCIDNKTWTGVAIDTLTALVIDYEVMSLYCHGCIDNKTWTGVAIDTLTGLVIDYEVMSLYCHGCVDNKTWTGARERLAWEEAHAPDCCIKYAGSFKSMETEAAKRIWSRSVDKYKLRYTEMLSNSDSTTFKAVKR